MPAKKKATPKAKIKPLAPRRSASQAAKTVTEGQGVYLLVCIFTALCIAFALTALWRYA